MKIRFTLLILLFTQSIFAQDLDTKIPQNAYMVIYINLKSISAKNNLNALSKYDFLKESNKYTNKKNIVKEILGNITESSINTNNKAFMYLEKHDSVNTMNYIFSVNDASKFKNYVEKILNPSDAKTKTKFEKNGKVFQIVDNKTHYITIDDKNVVISIWDYPYYNTYSNSDDYYSEQQKVRQYIDSVNQSKGTPNYYDDNIQIIDTAVSVEENIIENQEEIAVPVVPVEEQTIEENVDTSVAESEYNVEDIAVEAAPEVTEAAYNDDYSYDSVMIAFEKKWDEIRRVREEKYFINTDLFRKQYVKSTLNNSRNITLLPGYATIKGKADDFGLWVNNSAIGNQLVELVSKRYTKKYDSTGKQIQNKPYDFYNGLETYILGNFDNGAINTRTVNNFNNEAGALISKVYQNKGINPEYLKYIKKENLIAMITMNAKYEALYDFYFKSYSKAFESAANPEEWAQVGIEMFNLFFNKDMAFNTFSSDGIFAITGIMPFKYTSTKYKYDEYTYKSTPYTETEEIKIPEFIYCTGISNQANIDKILESLLRLKAIVKQKNNVYKINSPNTDINSLLYIIIENGKLIFTNDESILSNRNGFGLDKAINPVDYNFSNNNAFLYFNANKTFTYLAQQDNKNYYGDPKYLHELADKIQSITMESKTISNNSMESTTVLKLKNANQNSITELFDLMETLYQIRITK